MISSLNASNQTFLNDLRGIQSRLSRAQQEVSSGLKVITPSDAPDQISGLLQVRAHLASTQQIATNLGRVKTDVDSSEQGLESAVSLVEKVRTLAAQGQTGTQTATGRKAIGDQIGSILEQIVGISRTTVEGRYVFSGDSDQTAPYSIDLAQTNPVSAYGGTAATRQVQHPNGSTFAVAKTAQEIFDSPDATQNVFSSISALRTALLNNDQPGIDAAIENVTGANTYLNQQLAFYGTAQNKVSDASDYGATLQTQLQAHLSSIQNADPTEAILMMTQATTQQQAALESRAKLPRTSLFDFLG